MGELTTIERAQRALAQRTSRRGFLGRVGRGVVALAGGSLVATALAPDRAEAHHICGHTFTTGSCPHPYAPLSRTDRYGFPSTRRTDIRSTTAGSSIAIPTNQDAIEDLRGEGPPRSTPASNDTRYGGGWTRCCSGRLRHIQDCCSRSNIRINGDYAVRGYCPSGLKVFCITYRELTQGVLTDAGPAALAVAAAVAGWSALWGP